MPAGKLDKCTFMVKKIFKLAEKSLFLVTFPQILVAVFLFGLFFAC